jgi:hypothetical protein
MPGSNAKESFNEQYAFDSTINSLLVAVKGKPILRVPDDQARAVDAEHHVIVNVFKRQSDWFENYFAGRSDAVTCEYVRTKLLERVKDKPIPLHKTAGGVQNLVAHLAELELRHHRGETALDEMVLIDLRRVTCFTDGERRRFVAHFNTANISL